MIDFQSLLEDFSQGQMPNIRRPKPSLLPSEQAVQDVTGGADDFIKRAGDWQDWRKANPQAEGNAGALGQGSGRETPSAGSMAIGALGGANKAMQGIMAQPPSPSLDFGGDTAPRAMPITRSGPLQGYRNGGFMQPGEEGIVGEDEPEIVRALPDGGVEIIPGLGRAGMGEPRRSTPDMHGEEVPYRALGGEPYGIAQTENEQPIVPNGPDGPQPELMTTIPTRSDPNDIDALRRKQLEVMDIKPSPWKDFGFGLLSGLNSAYNNTPMPKGTYSEIRRDRKLAPISGKLQAIEDSRKTDTDIALREAQTRTIPIDDANKKLEIQERMAAAKAAQTGQALRKLVGLKWVNPKNAAHAGLTTAANLKPEDVEGWDDRNPYTKQVAGVTYVYDKTDQTFKPSNIPTDESATLTDYEVKMPNGERRMFKVAQKDAARFATQMEVLGAQIEASARRQENQQEFTAKQNDINRKESLRRWATSNRIRRTEFVRDTLAKVEDGLLTREQADQMIADFPVDLQ